MKQRSKYLFAGDPKELGPAGIEKTQAALQRNRVKRVNELAPELQRIREIFRIQRNELGPKHSLESAVTDLTKQRARYAKKLRENPQDRKIWKGARRWLESRKLWNKIEIKE
jgi:hypothetical protein